MSALHLTRHAILRMSQRGIGVDDIELVESIGTQVERGSYFLRRKDVQAFERQLKKIIDQVRRLQATATASQHRRSLTQQCVVEHSLRNCNEGSKGMSTVKVDRWKKFDPYSNESKIGPSMATRQAIKVIWTCSAH
jgi:hypothetical protein